MVDTMQHFQREMLSEWPEPTPWENIADYCWLLYCWKTEKYDRAICNPPQRHLYGEVIPQPGRERQLSTTFARQVQLDMGRLALRLAGLLELDRAVTKEEWYSARSAAQRIPFDKLEEQLNRHPIGAHVAALRRQ